MFPIKMEFAFHFPLRTRASVHLVCVHWHSTVTCSSRAHPLARVPLEIPDLRLPSCAQLPVLTFTISPFVAVDGQRGGHQLAPPGLPRWLWVGIRAMSIFQLLTSTTHKNAKEELHLHRYFMYRLFSHAFASHRPIPDERTAIAPWGALLLH